MKSLPAPLARLAAAVAPLAERIDRLSVRERVLVFGAGVVLLYVTWQGLAMDPLAARARAAEQRLVDLRARVATAAALGEAAERDPARAAAVRVRSLEERRAELDARLQDAATGYVAPGRMVELVREVLARQQGLRLVALANRPVESLATPAAPVTGAAAPDEGVPAADDRGPFLHPVEVVVEGDYTALVAYVRALEALPWRVQWRHLELAAGEYPVSRLRLEVATLGLSRQWLGV